jgi:ring-1,2-phenylacetyl-CoA epoxidase subunit PaaC
MLRQFWFAAFMNPWWQAMERGSDETLSAIAAKAVKETAYHIRHAGEWVIRLGDGTEESARRMAAAAEALAPYLDELFEGDEVTKAVAAADIAPEPVSVRPAFDRTVAQVFSEAFLEMPAVAWPQNGGRKGRHTEAMGFLLADLQYMQRTYPGAVW